MYLLNTHRPQIEGKQLLLSQMHDLKASCTFLEGREGRERKGREGRSKEKGQNREARKEGAYTGKVKL